MAFYVFEFATIQVQVIMFMNLLLIIYKGYYKPKTWRL